jgi:ribosomal protein S20
MGHSLSADKRERQNLKRRHKNRGNMIVLRKTMKSVTAAISAGGADALGALAKGFQALDRATRKNAIPKKRADRKKARLALALARSAKTPKAPQAAEVPQTAEPVPAAPAPPTQA